MNPLLILFPGGDVWPGGEQVPELWATSVHLRSVQRRMGQAGPVGRPSPGLLQQCALAHPGASTVVSFISPGNSRRQSEEWSLFILLIWSRFLSERSRKNMSVNIFLLGVVTVVWVGLTSCRDLWEKSKVEKKKKTSRHESRPSPTTVLLQADDRDVQEVVWSAKQSCFFSSSGSDIILATGTITLSVVTLLRPGSCTRYWGVLTEI